MKFFLDRDSTNNMARICTEHVICHRILFQVISFCNILILQKNRIHQFLYILFSYLENILDKISIFVSILNYPTI